MSRVKRTIVFLPLVAALLAMAAPLPVLAADDYPDEFAVMMGLSRPDRNLVGEDISNPMGPVGTLRYTHFFSDHLGGFTDMTWAGYKGDSTVPDDTMAAARLGAEWLFSPGQDWRWSVTFGGGWMGNHPRDGNGYSRGIVSLGFGQRRTMGTRDSFRWEIRADQNVSDAGLDGADIMNVHAMLGWAWGFGGAPKDSDGDGVIDRKDKCPNTPRGAVVDVKGCPLDADGDGVYDGLDKCPGTPKGVKVDADGCPLDSDGDGVPDYLDKCPNTPRGVKVDATGCPLDSDGDGVPDYLDKCPNTPKGTKVDAAGCPPDRDGDGVPDYLDKCPDTPKGVKVDATGCPLPPPPPAHTTEPIFKEGKKSLVLEGVNFEYNSSKLTPASEAVLDKVAASLVDWSDVKLEVGGHTDGRGADAYNMKLSQARAESVLNYLGAKGVAASRLTAKGFGKTLPIADNKTDAGRATNRRVELTQTN
jgi:outer membrane protein OmpA-like peptidoglycan-associated protein